MGYGGCDSYDDRETGSEWLSDDGGGGGGGACRVDALTNGLRGCGKDLDGPWALYASVSPGLLRALEGDVLVEVGA